MVTVGREVVREIRLWSFRAKSSADLLATHNSPI
jgi:hypothetical protein